MDEEQVGEEHSDGVSIGRRLREAREAKGLSLEELAASTRIPQRHLESLEAEQWDKLPAATYTVGFAKTYADEVGLDQNSVADDVRTHLGAQPVPERDPNRYEMAEPGRSMPRWVIPVVIALIVAAILLFSYLNEQSLIAEEEAAEAVAPEAEDPVLAQPQAPLDDTVVLSANRNVWMRIADGNEVLFARELAAGERFVIPEDAENPVLETVRPEWLDITVGGEAVPQLGPAGERVRDVSLGADSLRDRLEETTGDASPSPAAEPARTASATPSPAPQPRPRPAPRPQPESRPQPEPETRPQPEPEPQSQPRPTPRPPAPEPEPEPAPAPVPQPTPGTPPATTGGEEAATGGE